MLSGCFAASRGGVERVSVVEGMVVNRKIILYGVIEL